ncbi:hypothetical protein [Natronococcus occultus]|uniref:Uncharacterized protein n=1 Tax=Natronococcus occultus SP4 TaxID=694430 RepID=L0JY58_9EURY|nr:hypothetical protein [Natronococcus occultus]AGB37235.1 hypothetical protein Natoc_1424 [Natronococcus occultus SP4]
MSRTPRTYLRLFLLGGGVLVGASGLLGGDTVQLLVGAAAVVLGAIGLLAERRTSSE